MNEITVLPDDQLHLARIPVEVLSDRDDLTIGSYACVHLRVPARVRVARKLVSTAEQQDVLTVQTLLIA
ncbi:hypothetical protein [Streptomyces lonarensis]|uniref:Uncharacterized protein n=1 Tax=Streptomyces lonarensis TaxID=700599 RepID=A0A7X6CYR2_9ACTN|nr:hypothetical protein [Streptomyces lonarensis]NJQ05028.1 hypothetical protein [Streptomyces lonarensis]